MISPFIVQLKSALVDYRTAVKSVKKSEYEEDFRRLIDIVEQIIQIIEIGDLKKARLLSLAFSRSVTDSFAVQPNEYKNLSKLICMID